MSGEPPLGRVQAAAGWVLGSGHVLAKALRFAAVGVTNGAVYALVTALLVSVLNMAPVPASVIGYLASLPTGFLGHRLFSFRSRGRWTGEAVRFVVTHLFNIALSAATMKAVVGLFGLPYQWGMLATVILIPLTNFLLMNLWIFRNQPARGR